ncbi:MAG: cytochrome c [Cyclobacteriaceae bacterium]|nr:cytochrome c [Cyclobacteriaceae bacterium]
MIKFYLYGLICFSSISFFSFQQKQKFNIEASIARGKEVYNTYCMSCHQDQGTGIEDIYPPLAKSDYLMADKGRSIIQTLYGVTGAITVNGKVYNTDMMGFDLSDQEVSDVLNYVRNSFNGKSAAVTPEEVNAVRK